MSDSINSGDLVVVGKVGHDASDSVVGSEIQTNTGRSGGPGGGGGVGGPGGPGSAGGVGGPGGAGGGDTVSHVPVGNGSGGFFQMDNYQFWFGLVIGMGIGLLCLMITHGSVIVFTM